MEKRSSKETLVSLTEAFPQGAPEDTVRRMASQLADALAVYEKQGIVHQAVKQKNVFILPTGGFQLGKPESSRMPCGGDISCMCPEMYWGEGFDSRADVYALGLLLYTMLNDGCPPLIAPGASAETVRTASLRRLEGEPLPPPKNGSGELQQVVLRACAYEPAQRYGSAAQMKGDLNG